VWYLNTSDYRRSRACGHPPECCVQRTESPLRQHCIVVTLPLAGGCDMWLGVYLSAVSCLHLSLRRLWLGKEEKGF